ncbi:TetR/AcrR family transcriptional regulator [Sphingomonas adhaesiva]|uniref:TetR/AcrR family transcriptional regulator n=1 Tax=Sphingomonas adhaesiva TaxID=28212 RepID=UPI002FFC5213
MARSRTSKTGTEQDVSLDTKLAPSQDRSKVTFEIILKAAGELLGEVGIERLSTNMICERARLTPPALYRYFPNKYAILRELGERLMKAEDRIVFRALATRQVALDQPLDRLVERRAELLTKVRRVARRVPGGEWILRVMRAVPVLQEVRIQSTRSVADEVFARLHAEHPAIDERRLRVATLLSTALGSAANDLAWDEPGMEAEISIEFARMMALYYRNLAGIAVEQVVRPGTTD